MVVRRVRGPDAFIPKVMYVLNERLDALPNGAFSFGVSAACQFVARKGFLKDRHEWPITRKIHRPRFSKLHSARGHVQSDKGLPSTGHASDEHDCLVAVGARALDYFFDADRRNAQVPGACVVSRDSVN